MAIAFYRMSTVKRAEGRSALAASAYIACRRLKDHLTGEVFDFRRKGGLHSALVVAPEERKVDREVLWNAAEAAETRSNSVVARSTILALPHELDKARYASLVEKHARYLATRHGVAVDIAIHLPGEEGDVRNWHAHLLLTTRQVVIGPGGEVRCGKKTRELDEHRTGSAIINEWRRHWQDCVNEAIRHLGIQIDVRSYAKQGIERAATEHLGPAKTNLLRRATREILEEVRAARLIYIDAVSADGRWRKFGREVRMRRAAIAAVISPTSGPTEDRDRQTEVQTDEPLLLAIGDLKTLRCRDDSPEPVHGREVGQASGQIGDHGNEMATTNTKPPARDENEPSTAEETGRSASSLPEAKLGQEPRSLATNREELSHMSEPEPTVDRADAGRSGVPADTSHDENREDAQMGAVGSEGASTKVTALIKRLRSESEAAREREAVQASKNGRVAADRSKPSAIAGNADIRSVDESRMRPVPAQPITGRSDGESRPGSSKPSLTGNPVSRPQVDRSDVSSGERVKSTSRTAVRVELTILEMIAKGEGRPIRSTPSHVVAAPRVPITPPLGMPRDRPAPAVIKTPATPTPTPAPTPGTAAVPKQSPAQAAPVPSPARPAGCEKTVPTPSRASVRPAVPEVKPDIDPAASAAGQRQAALVVIQPASKPVEQHTVQLSQPGASNAAGQGKPASSAPAYPDAPHPEAAKSSVERPRSDATDKTKAATLALSASGGSITLPSLPASATKRVITDRIVVAAGPAGGAPNPARAEPSINIGPPDPPRLKSDDITSTPETRFGSADKKKDEDKEIASARKFGRAPLPKAQLPVYPHTPERPKPKRAPRRPDTGPER